MIQAVKKPPNCHRLSFLVRPGKSLFIIWVMMEFYVFEKNIPGFQNNTTAYVTERSFPKLSHSSVSFFLLCFFSLVIHIYHFFNLCFLYEKDLGNKTLVFSLLNSSSFWFGLHSFLCWKRQR